MTKDRYLYVGRIVALGAGRGGRQHSALFKAFEDLAGDADDAEGGGDDIGHRVVFRVEDKAVVLRIAVEALQGGALISRNLVRYHSNDDITVTCRIAFLNENDIAGANADLYHTLALGNKTEILTAAKI